MRKVEIHTLISLWLPIKSIDKVKKENHRYVQQLQVPQVQVMRVSVGFLEFFLFLLQDCNTEGTGLQLPNAASISQELTEAGNKAVMTVRKTQFGGNKRDMSLWKDIIIVSLKVISCHLTSHP